MRAGRQNIASQLARLLPIEADSRLGRTDCTSLTVYTRATMLYVQADISTIRRGQEDTARLTLAQSLHSLRGRLLPISLAQCCSSDEPTRARALEAQTA